MTAASFLLEMRAAAGDDFATDVTRWLHDAASGHCGATDDSRAAFCEEDDRGSFGLPEAHTGSWRAAVAHCLERCAQCTRCRHITVSRTERDCSWYYACPRTFAAATFRSAAAPARDKQRAASPPCSHAWLGAVAPGATIPRLLHQSWKDGRLLPAHRCLSKRWRTTLPRTWRRGVWSDAANRQLWQRHMPDLLPMYDGYRHPVQRADATRLLYMHAFGGVYSDLDLSPCASAADALARHSSSAGLLLVRDPIRTADSGDHAIVSNFFFASVKGHPFWRFAIERLREAASVDVIQSTGPKFLDTAYNAWRAASASCRPQLPRAEVLDYPAFQRSIGVHHFFGSWQPKVAGQLKLKAQLNMTIIYDEGLLGWLGVNRSLDCPGGQLRRVLEPIPGWDRPGRKYRDGARSWAVDTVRCNGVTARPLGWDR